MMMRNCLIALIVLTSMLWPPAAARSAPTPPALALASMMLTVDDFAAAGWSGLEVVSDWQSTAADLADRAVWPTGAGDELDAVEAELLAAGWRQGYAISFAAPADPTRVLPGRQAEVEVAVFADSTGAKVGFSLVPDAYLTGPATTAAVRAIGDESRLTRVEARDPQAGTPNQELVLGFRTGRFTARILLRDWSGEEPEVATIERLGALLQSRLAGDGAEPAFTGHGQAATLARGHFTLPSYVVGANTCTRSFSVSAM